MMRGGGGAGQHCLTVWELLILDHFGLKPVACFFNTLGDQTKAATLVKRGVLVKMCWSGQNTSGVTVSAAGELEVFLI